MVIYFRKKPPMNSPNWIYNQVVENVQQYKYLGTVPLSD